MGGYTKMYTMNDFPALKKAVLGKDGVWPMMKKDLFQMANMPSYFNTITHPKLGTGLNLSLVIVTMSTLETVATLANIDGSIHGQDKNFATDVVVAYGERYFPRVNTRYSSLPGESIVRLLWDAYRNGGLHRFLPKKHNFISDVGKKTTVTFGVVWLEDPSRPNRCCNLDEVSKLRAKDPTLARISPPHLVLTSDVGDSINFWICAQALVLELADSAEEWEKELKTRSDLATWFVDGVNAFEKGLELGSGLTCLQKIIAEVQR